MASIEQDIIDWAKTRPVWQQNVIVKIARGEAIDEAYIASTANSIVKGTVAPEGAPLTVADIPTGGAVGATVGLTSIGELTGVNALLPGQNLTFGATGLTVIYGDNGSGKSGYARLAKELVDARHHEKILPNAYAVSASTQSAQVAYSVDGDARTGAWPGLSDGDLRGVHFYDEACGDDYLVSETELTYRPSVLKIFDRLIEITDRLRDVVDGLITANIQSRTALPVLTPGTKSSVFLEGIGAKTKPAELDALIKLEDDAAARHAELLAEVARLRGTDPSKEKQRLKSAAASLSTLADHLDSIEKTLSVTAGNAVLVQQTKAAELRAAAVAASQHDFADEPLEGVGSEAWRALWAAAERFSAEEAYPDREFPAAEAGDYCVLCQQPLDDDGRTRLARFHQFVHNDLEQQAKDAEKMFADSLIGLRDFTVSTTATTSALAFLVIEDRPRAQALQGAIETAQQAKDRLATRLTKESTDDLIALSVADIQGVRTLATTVKSRADAIDETAFKKNLSDTIAAQDELGDAIQLSKSGQLVRDEIARLGVADSLKKMRGALSTTGMTTKSTELARTYVTAAVSDRFVRESERLKLDHVVLGDRGGTKGKLKHKPALLGASANSPEEVLSEGEQTAAGLAGLFTEVNFDDTKSAIVLDDPVSSLDHERRDRTAKRVAELANDRQVIVFTHDLMFLGELVKAAGEHGVLLTERAIERDADGIPGHIIEGYPWKAKDAQQRLQDLQERLNLLKKERGGFTSEEWELRASDWAGRLSETWERLVRTEVANQVVDRSTSEVRPKMFRILARITADDDADFQAGYSQVSKWARRHDKSEEVSFTPPTVEEMQSELTRAMTWRKRIAGYKQS